MQCCYVVVAQNINGKVISEATQEAIPWANVILLQKQDSVFITGTVTDEYGKFSLNKPDKNCLLKISCLGFQTLFTETINNATEVYVLKIDTALLSEVQVFAKTPITKIEDGGISTDIQNSRLKEIGTAEDVLAKLPFVTKDKENFTVFGRGIPLIYVNNRLVRDLSELSEINSSNIKKVNVITAPGAEYDATVNSIIKIDLVKKQGDGFSGLLSNNLQLNRKFSHGEMADLNYRTGKLDIFGLLRFVQQKDEVNIELNQSVRDENDVMTVNESAKQKISAYSLKTRLGMNYAFNDKHSFGIKHELMFVPEFIPYLESQVTILNNNILAEKFNATTNNKNDQKTNSVNAYYSGFFANWLSAKLDVDFVDGKLTDFQHVTNYRFDNEELIETNNNKDYSLFAGKLTFTTPINSGNLTYGGDYSYTDYNQVFTVASKDGADDINPDNNLAKQSLAAGFVTFNKSFNQFSLDLGLRYENVQFSYYIDEVKVQEQSKNYSNFFPNVRLTYSAGKLQTMLGLRSTTKRPNYYQLRSSIQYDNPYAYEIGNPYLKPSTRNILSYLFKYENFNLISSFAIEKNPIEYIHRKYTDFITVFQPVNLSKKQHFSISAAYERQFGIWNPNIELTFNKEYIVDKEFTYLKNKPRFGFLLDNAFLFQNDLQFGAELSYTSRGNECFQYYDYVFYTDLYLSKVFFNNKLRVNLQVTDIFNTNREKRTFEIDNITKYNYNDLNSRGIILTLTYRFNATQNKYKGEKATDELNRL